MPTRYDLQPITWRMWLDDLLAHRGVRFVLIVGAVFLGFALIAIFGKAQARGFEWFFAHRHPVHCSEGRPVAVSYYWDGRHTASGEAFDANGNTAASRSLPFGTHVTLRNPRNGHQVTVRVNDRGPYGAAHRLGIYLDIARGAARRLGINETSWVCAL